MCVCVHVYTVYIGMYVCTHFCMYIYNTYTYMHTDAHARVNNFKLLLSAVISSLTSSPLLILHHSVASTLNPISSF